MSPRSPSVGVRGVLHQSADPYPEMPSVLRVLLGAGLAGGAGRRATNWKGVVVCQALPFFYSLLPGCHVLSNNLLRALPTISFLSESHEPK